MAPTQRDLVGARSAAVGTGWWSRAGAQGHPSGETPGETRQVPPGRGHGGQVAGDLQKALRTVCPGRHSVPFRTRTPGWFRGCSPSTRDAPSRHSCDLTLSAPPGGGGREKTWCPGRPSGRFLWGQKGPSGCLWALAFSSLR